MNVVADRKKAKKAGCVIENQQARDIYIFSRGRRTSCTFRNCADFRKGHRLTSRIKLVLLSLRHGG